MSNETQDVTYQYRLAERAAKAFNPGEQPDIGKLMQSAYTHGYAQALIDYVDFRGGFSRNLLKLPSKVAPPGCHCTTRCMAPVVMGRQTPCRDPERFASTSKSESP